MYILTRYAVWEVVKLFLAALLAFTMVITFGMGVQKGLDMGLPPMVILRIMPVMLPEILGITIPVAMLFAVSSAFGRMTGSNEIVALKSLGISPMAVIAPVLVLAGFLSLGTVWIYEVTATWSRPGVKRTVIEAAVEIGYSMLRTNNVCSLPPKEPVVHILVSGVDGRTLIRPAITIGQRKITAETAEISAATKDKHAALFLSAKQATIDVRDMNVTVHKDLLEETLPLPEPGRDMYHRDWVSTREIPDRIAELRLREQRLQPLRDANYVLGESVNAADDEIALTRSKIYSLRAEPYRRWANGFTCLCFALIGIPVAMIWRHVDVLTNFFVCFLPILAIYYPLLVISDDLATSGSWPAASFWLGNLLLFGVAMLLFRKIRRH